MRRALALSVQQARIKELEREVPELRLANEILKAAARFFARQLATTAEIVAFVDAHRQRFGVVDPGGSDRAGASSSTNLAS